jgi:carbonic anhydrase
VLAPWGVGVAFAADSAMPSASPPPNAIAENARLQVAQLKSSPPVVDKLYAAKKMGIVGAAYDLRTGSVALV